MIENAVAELSRMFTSVVGTVGFDEADAEDRAELERLTAQLKATQVDQDQATRRIGELQARVSQLTASEQSLEAQIGRVQERIDARCGR